MDAGVSRTLGLIVRAFVRCGYSPRSLAAEFEAQSKLYRRDPQHNRGISADDDLWFQILTLWSMDPLYVDAQGAPRALSPRGAAPSVEALVRQVGSRMSVQKVCNNLIRTGAARRVGARLIALAHGPILFPPGSRALSRHQLAVLQAVLVNLEHNAKANTYARWFERQAIAHHFPESAVASYSAEASKRAQNFLSQEDATMHRIASMSPTEKRRMRASVLMLFCAHPSSTVAIEPAEKIDLRRHKRTTQHTVGSSRPAREREK